MAMDKVKISVVTVCYNAENTIEETIRSVVDQTYDNIEYIIIDGGSTDGTIDIIKKYSDHLAYWVSEPDKGIYDAMNKGINIATGDYIYFIGSDDTLIDNKVLKVVSELMGNERFSIFYGNVLLQPAGKKYDGIFSKWKLIRKNICHQAIFYPINILRDHHYSLKYRTFSDYYENLVLWGKKVKFCYIPLTVCNFMVGGTSITGDVDFFSDRSRNIKRIFGLTGYVYFLVRVKLVDILLRR